MSPKRSRGRLRARLHGSRDRLVRSAVGTNLPATRDDVRATRRGVDRQTKELATIRAAIRDLGERLDVLITAQAASAAVVERIAGEVDRLHTTVDGLTGLATSARDDLPALRARLGRLRRDPEYAAAWEEDDPLVTVRIASYNDTAGLVERALPSVFAQTHKNLEIVIVNDGPNPETRAAVEALAEPRVRYVEFPFRRVYPEDRRHRWMVAGSPGMNEGARLATGRWIAPLDDDDEFSPDHVERLLDLARRERAELVYGAFDRLHDATGRHLRIFAYPPKLGGFTFQAAMYHSGLRFFEYDEESWRVDEPGDWNLCRRMLQAGVSIAAVDEIVGVMHHVALADKAL